MDIPEKPSLAIPIIKRIESDVESETTLVEPKPSSSSKATKHIFIATSLMLMPLLLSVVLLYLVYHNLERPGDGHGIRITTEDGTTQNTSKFDYYVKYSATRIVFISSLSSTLALALIPVAMALFSYITASTWHTSNPTNLPTPSQFELSLRLLGGGILDLAAYFRTLFSPHAHLSPMLNHIAITLTTFLSLALLITIIDAILHIKVTTLSYTATHQVTSPFRPSRLLPSQCWNATPVGPSWSDSTKACNIILTTSGKPWIANSTEAYKTMAKSSTTNFINLDNTGTSLIVPPNPPPGISFTAKSFTSKTTCQMITDQCTISASECPTCSAQTYSCFSPANLTGNLADSNLALPFGAAANLALQFYNTSSKSSPSDDIYHAVNGSIYFAFPFTLGGIELDYSSTFSSLQYDPKLQLFASVSGEVYGIMSCDTSLSEVRYTYFNESLQILDSQPMNDSASAPFFQTVSQGYANSFLEAGLNTAAAQAGDAADLAEQFSRVFDRTILGLSSGILVSEEAKEMRQETTNMVARVPRGEFLLLILVNGLEAGLGLVVGIWAMICMRRKGVREVKGMMGLEWLVDQVFGREGRIFVRDGGWEMIDDGHSDVK